MYRRTDDLLEVLLIHPGGPFWTHKDLGSWSIPKGEYEASEDALEAAKREFIEETGFVCGDCFIPLGTLKQRSGKLVSAWAFEGDCDSGQLVSNVFEMEWPPRSGKLQSFPEADRAAWFEIEEARRRIAEGQLKFLDELKGKL
jgi:predicted NUDIX family NTP pyrophosphohydrolase